eukprot:CAMPEP_0118940350 /NCGR_PEP_ID=MMETSP1169-20130426/31272_1 /TAXON_ID=36882 /ORGANISM="Pyramimonas obovata, Strain CCMP722" /LENGTH=314 /DNA_ID=CAMNT_0006884821 /DNA_START=369 /DNA_END=1310 /DNA_ORIENTATION=+
MASEQSVPMTVGGFQLEGLSVGGQETCIVVPQFKVAFDIGRCPQKAVYMETVLFSHCHLDHVSGIGAYVGSRSMLSLSPPLLVLPKPNLPAVEALLDAYRQLDTSSLPCTLQPAEVGDVVQLSKLYVAKVFPTDHVVPSQGYLIYSQKNKLKPEYSGLPGQKIKELREAGTEVCNLEQVPEVAFTGDTTASWITDPANKDVLRAKLLIMEVTFLDDNRTAEDARRFGHTHIDEVAAHAHLFHNEAILFIHFSARFGVQEIETLLDERLPPDLRRRVTPLLHGFAHKQSRASRPTKRDAHHQPGGGSNNNGGGDG